MFRNLVCILICLSAGLTTFAKDNSAKGTTRTPAADLDVAAVNKEVSAIKKKYSKCMDDAQSNMDMKMCTGKAFDEADKLLNVAYNKIQGNLLADIKEPFSKEMNRRLTAAQRAWVAFKETECPLRGMDMYEGSGESLVVSGCLYSMTMDRIKDLTFRAQTN